MTDKRVQAWSERVTIPTYRIGPHNRNPMFLEKRVYQGSSGAVYPHPVIDKVYDEVEDATHTALFLENRWLKIMILPDLGGRVQMALDKTIDYHFVYYNRVIKPALVGLTGPWVSGGIEFNWPQHHRPSTYEPVDWSIEKHDDGGATVWCSELEQMFRTKGMHGFTLHPDKAYLEIGVKLYNRTGSPQTFLWWANPAVHVNDDYQSVFPPDVHAVMDHGKRDVSTFPIATGEYYKVDYAPGADISRYKNIPVPTSYMAYHSDFDFVGCYDHGKQAGMMHVANHHLVPGKKQWTWGNGDFGCAWDRQLTDTDGPYIELMCGAFTDNQPDFSWLMPGEEKTFTQVFMPYKLIGVATNATNEAVIKLDVERNLARMGVYATSPGAVMIELWRSEPNPVRVHNHKNMNLPAVTRSSVGDGTLLHACEVELTPETAWTHDLALPDDATAQELTLRVMRGERVLVQYTPLPDEEPITPSPASSAKAPAEIATNEELYLNGQHLEQYRHATYTPEPYYQEALRRDAGDARCNNAMGLLLYRRGKFDKAEAYFRKAIERLTLRNPNPYDGEPYYNLGRALVMQGRYADAFDAYYKAVWNDAWKPAAYFELARIACRDGRYDEALALAEQSIERNASHHQARHLRIALLRKLGHADAARDELAEALRRDRFNYGAINERALLGGDDSFAENSRGNVHTYIEIALDYAHAGLFDESVALLECAPDTNPMARYYLGWMQSQRGDAETARRTFEAAAKTKAEFCAPNRIECVPALRVAQQLNPADARAPYYLGNFWYGHRRHDEAIAAWQRSVELDNQYPTAHRNLGLAYMNVQQDADKARSALETAFVLDPTDSRVLFELDQLYKKINLSIEERLAQLDKHEGLVADRDDLTVEYVALLNLTRRHERALSLLTRRNFHPWEGGEGKSTRQYEIALVELARQQIVSGDPGGAIALLDRARSYPPNLAEGKLAGARENQIDYWAGCAHEKLGNDGQACACFESASRGSTEPASAMYYNDAPPDMIFYIGLAMRKLGREREAQAVFNRLTAYGNEHIDDDVRMDYFAVSLPDFMVFEDDLNQRNRMHCEYMLALGQFGLGNTDLAQRAFDEVIAQQADHAGARLHRALMCEAGEAHSLGL